ncbi:MAG: hypothetical protein WBD31_10415 [Rubripirellula sp.]
MSPIAKFFLIVTVAGIVIPSSAAVYTNWTDIRPYLIGDANAPGHLLYFSRHG